MHLGMAVTSVVSGDKVVRGGFGGFCGLRELVDGVQSQYTHFESPQTAHGQRNGMHFSPVPLRGGWDSSRRHFAPLGSFEVI